MKTLILGLGNPILTDDGVGVLAAEALRVILNGEHGTNDTGGAGTFSARSLYARHTDTAEAVDIQEVSVGGLALMETMIGYERVILIDALEWGSAPPGTIQRMTLDDLRTISPTQHSASPHDASLITALDLGHRMGLQLPECVIIYGIGVENVIDFGEQPTSAVAAAIPMVTQAVLQELCKGAKDNGFT